MNPKVAEPQCDHPSMDGLAQTDVMVCMACCRLVRRVDIPTPAVTFSTTYELNATEVKALFRALEINKETAIAAERHQLGALDRPTTMADYVEGTPEQFQDLPKWPRRV